MPMQVTWTEIRRGSFVQVTLNVTNKFDDPRRPAGDVVTNAPIDIDNLAQVWFRLYQLLPPNFNEYNKTFNPISIQIKSKLSDVVLKTIEKKNVIVTMHVKCDAVKYSEQWVCTEEMTSWKHVGNISGNFEGYQYKLEPFEVDIIVIKKEIVTFEKLYEDMDLIDFELRTEEGSVSVHKACLAAHSDVFKTMLCHEWKETANGSIKIQGVTLQTLRDLKNYIYLNTLPETDEALRTLLILASYYFMDVLVSECIGKLTAMVSSKNLQSLLEYACAYNIPELTFAIIERTPAHVVNDAQLNRKLVKEDSSDEKSESI